MESVAEDKARKAGRQAEPGSAWLSLWAYLRNRDCLLTSFMSA